MKLLKYNNKGFSLTEVMIGMMILTVAIVAATNLLSGMATTNRNNLTTMQAYYYAIEGLEGVRNIRDSNWLHNRDWLGSGSLDVWGGTVFDPTDEGKEYRVDLQRVAQGAGEGDVDFANISQFAPWTISDGGGDHEVQNIIADAEGNLNNGFKRVITVTPYGEGEEISSVVVKVKVTWNIGAKERKLEMSEILTNWKDGVL